MWKITNGEVVHFPDLRFRLTIGLHFLLGVENSRSSLIHTPPGRAAFAISQ